VIQRDELAISVQDDPDGVEAEIPAGAVAHRAEPGDRHPADLGALEIVQGVPRRSAPLAARLDLDEHEVLAVAHHEIELSVARAVVAREHLVAEALEVRSRQLLPLLPSHVPDVRHAGDAMATPTDVSARVCDLSAPNQSANC
jgi:hypothetical protein